MRLQNRKTGEKATFVYLQNDYISPLVLTVDIDGEIKMLKYNSLAELNNDWEDYEEPKEYWCIDWTGGVNHIIPLDDSTDKYENNKKEIGNYFNTKEEAEKAVEKLKAWKRLKDNGFRILGWEWRRMPAGGGVCVILDYPDNPRDSGDFEDDLDLLFSGEEF